MSEKVMIDGCDVSECEHINACDKKMKCVILQDDVCEINPYCEGYDCYYKQLQRANEENERLKKVIKSINKPVFLPNIEQEATNNYRKALEEIREIWNPKNKWIITDCEEILKIQKIVNEVLKEGGDK